MNVPVATPDETQSASSAAVSGRIYSGRFASQRAQERHDRLLEAGIEVFGTTGYPTAKIKTLCQCAGLSERYFYESFESREHLLTVVYDRVSTELMAQTRKSFRDPRMDLLTAVRAGMASAVHFMLGDPRHAQIILVEIVGISAAFEEKRLRSIKLFAAESQRLLLLLAGIDLSDAAMAKSTPGHPLEEAVEFARLMGISVVGGVNSMLLDTLQGEPARHSERITEAAFQLICNVSLGVRAFVKD